MQGYLEEDYAALRKLRDESECDELKQAWGANDPREWKIEVRGKQERCVQVKGDRVTVLGLCFSSLAVLPDAIGELKALTELYLIECSNLAELPAAIGELGALTTLVLYGCSSLAELPAAIDGHKGLTLELPAQLVTGPLAEDFAALRKLRDDDASGALKEYFGDGEDPREWKGTTPYGSRQCVVVSDGRVTTLNLEGCSTLAALPAAIGELGALM